MAQTLVHLHLLLNHIPIIGLYVAVGLFLVALVTNKQELKHSTLTLFCLIALLEVPAYLSGNLAGEMIKNEPGVSQPLINAHQGAAAIAFIALLVTGGCAWSGVWQFHRRPKLAAWIVPAVLVSSLVTAGLMAVTGSTGGAIRHPELLAGEEAPSTIGALGVSLNAALQWGVVESSRFVWPILETLHFLGLILLLGVVGLLNLRMLGFFKQMPVRPLYRFIPFGIAGLGINIVTGMMFFVGMPFFYVFNADFHFKIGALVIAGITLLIYSTGEFREWENLEAGQSASTAAKCLAVASLVSWVAVIVFGRYMPMFEDTLDPFFQ